MKLQFCAVLHFCCTCPRRIASLGDAPLPNRFQNALPRPETGPRISDGLDLRLSQCHSLRSQKRGANNTGGMGMSKAFVFPGQGSQAVGMGKALAETFSHARAVLAEVDDALGQNLSLLMFEGPQAHLPLTANAQPAWLAVSLAAVRVLEAEAGLNLSRDASFVAGHSL